MARKTNIILQVVKQETWEARGEMITQFLVVHPVGPEVSFWEYTGGDPYKTGEQYRVSLERIDAAPHPVVE